MTRDPLDLGDEFDEQLADDDGMTEYLTQISSEESIKMAARLDLRVVLPKPFELLIDIDRGADLDTFNANIRIFRQFFGEAEFKMTPSKSEDANRFHITVTTKRPLSNLERIAFQAVLGSDSKRELLSLVRELVIKDEHPTLFFEDDK